MIRRTTLLIAAILTILPGCGTIQSKMSDRSTPPYAGVKDDVTKSRESFNDGKLVRGGLYALDAPVSFVADTVLLPFADYKK